MKILVVGGGGREHALAWKASRSKMVDHVFVAPGNAGTALEPGVSNVQIAAEDLEALLDFSIKENIDLTIVGPEMPLVCGIVDLFKAAGLRIFGPSAAASQLEGSKTFTKDFLARHQIPSARYKSFTEINPAIAYVRQQGAPIVVKADGLAAGKGVILAENKAQATDAVHNMLAGNAFGEAGHRVVIEELLEGEEASFICIVDGEQVLPMATSQDHKTRDNGDQGPNTGGMGAYSPAPVVTTEVEARIMRDIIMPTVSGMQAEGVRYTGVLYAGLMINQQGEACVLEYNCRFGDPETQPIMMRLKSDLVELCLAACDGELDSKTAQWDSRNSLGVVLAADGYPEKYAKGELIQNIPPENESSKIFHAGTNHDQHGNIVSSGGRVLCSVALGNNISEAQQKAYRLAEQIVWEGAYYRTDIGYKAL